MTLGYNESFNHDSGIEEALASLDAERRKLSRLSEMWKDGETKVRAKDNSLEMTFDGRGELTGISFNEAKYRLLAPTQLAEVLKETLQRGRAQSIEKMTEIMGSTSPGGVDLAGLAGGKTDPQDVLEALIGPLLGGFGTRRAEG
ncbi:YbaB/EbfC family nucleoid-associated protein [Lentzea cavernae]|uniref:YbaB/EbfC DNA-binding family protein n=1 Tax=Lentzea cavernae TaxID=2020703 RepID=A0ABQ3MRI0_9PSEU|nr:YbaB/EbfC family nucleoid-associated protein [Lentzea cavernae]GHH56519.1 hypothetical protein GCM10017774_74740 [Lentzea cavernae]